MGYVGNSWLVLYARVSLNYLSYLLALLSMFDGGILEVSIEPMCVLQYENTVTYINYSLV